MGSLVVRRAETAVVGIGTLQVAADLLIVLRVAHTRGLQSIALELELRTNAVEVTILGTQLSYVLHTAAYARHAMHQ